MNPASETSRVSDIVQKFGLSFGKKQIYNHIRSFLASFGKASCAAVVFPSSESASWRRLRAGVISIAPNFFPEASIAALLEPLAEKYFPDLVAGAGRRPAAPGDSFEFEFHGEGRAATRAAASDIRGSLAFPVFIDGRAFALFAIASDREFSLSAGELSDLNVIAYSAAASLKNISMRERIGIYDEKAREDRKNNAEAARRVSLALEYCQKMPEASSYEAILDLALDSFSRMFGVEQAVISVLDNYRNELTAERSIGFRPGPDEGAGGVPWSSLAAGAVLNASPYFRRSAADGTAELAAIPFPGVGGRPAGAVVLYDPRMSLVFDEDDFEMMWLMANVMSMALNSFKIRRTGELRTTSEAALAGSHVSGLLDLIGHRPQPSGQFSAISAYFSACFGARTLAVLAERHPGSFCVIHAEGAGEGASHEGSFIQASGTILEKAARTMLPQAEFGPAAIVSDDGTDLGPLFPPAVAVFPTASPSGGVTLYAVGGISGTGAEKLFDREFSALARKALEKVAVPGQADERPEERNADGGNAIAAEIQRKLIPRTPPAAEHYEIAAYCEPAACAGCDFYDFIQGESLNTTSIVLADVSGKGVNSALISAMLRTQVRTLVRTGHEMKKLLFTLNNLICEDIDLYNFVTMFLLNLSNSGNRATFCNAAHTPILHYVKDGGNVVAHESRNSPLGIMRNMEYKEGILLLEPGDVLLLYTNGLAEARNDAGEFVGRDRLVSFLAANADKPADAIMRDLLAMVREHSGSASIDDDITFVIVKVV